MEGWCLVLIYILKNFVGFRLGGLLDVAVQCLCKALDKMGIRCKILSLRGKIGICDVQVRCCQIRRRI